MKLQSMTDYVLGETSKCSYNDFYQKVFKYANFLKLNLENWMFIPSIFKNGEWIVLEEPKTPHTFASENSDLYIKKYEKELEQYQQAKENVIFDGFYITKKDDKHIRLKKGQMSIIFFIEDNEITFYDIFSDSEDIETIEDLVKYDLTLTDNAIKKYKL